MYDVAVVGAGPAGATAAIVAARAGASVLLLDRCAFPRDKACGDGIASQALSVLDGLGVTGVDAGYPEISRLSLTGPTGARAARSMSRGVRVIPREVFDARLVDAAMASGAVLRRHTVRSVAAHGDRVVIDGVGARTVVGADGASSVVRRHLGEAPNPEGHVALAIRGYAPHEGPLEQRIAMSARDWPAYAWSFPIGDGRRNVGYGEVLRGAKLTRGDLLRRLRDLLPDVDIDSVSAWRAHHLPLSTRRPAPGRDRVLLAGDALSLINPFTGEGIFYAVVSGALAGAAAATGRADAAELYASSLRSRLRRHLAHTGTAARLARYPRIVNGGIHAASLDQRVFDTFVELGLGDGLLTPRLLVRTVAEVVRAAPRARDLGRR